MIETFYVPCDILFEDRDPEFSMMVYQEERGGPWKTRDGWSDPEFQVLTPEMIQKIKDYCNSILLISF